MNVDVPKTTEQPEEYFFESLLDVSNGRIKINYKANLDFQKIYDISLILMAYESYIDVAPIDKIKLEKDSDQFKKLTGGYDLAKFAAYKKRREAELQK